jgi:RNA polymerase sigma-70 factor (ECF subfamily)
MGTMAENTTLTWEDVAHRYGRKIYTFAYRLTGNPDDAADLVQEVLLRVRKGLSSYTPGSFDGWLWRITRNAFLDGVRKKKRRPTSPLPEGDNSALGASPLSDDVQAALLKLPYDFREAVVLCDVVGLTYEEIADAVDVPVGTVRSRIHRGRTMLRGLLTWPV